MGVAQYAEAQGIKVNELQNCTLIMITPLAVYAAFYVTNVTGGWEHSETTKRVFEGH